MIECLRGNGDRVPASPQGRAGVSRSTPGLLPPHLLKSGRLGLDELVGALVVVTEGTTLADTLWMCTSNAGGTLGSTAVAWSKVYPLSSSLAVRDLEYAGSGVNITGCTAITFDADPGVPLDHPFTVTAGGSGEALIGMHAAGTLHAGVVTRYDQTMGLGVKTFSDDIIVNGAVFITHTTVGSTQIGGASGVTHIYTEVEATGDKYLSLTMGDDSPGNPPICIFGVNNVFGGSVSYPSGTIPCFAVFDSDLNLWRGATSTVSGLVFKGGLYTSGSLSVTVAAGDVTGLDARELAVCHLFALGGQVKNTLILCVVHGDVHAHKGAIAGHTGTTVSNRTRSRNIRKPGKTRPFHGISAMPGESVRKSTMSTVPPNRLLDGCWARKAATVAS